MNAIKLARLERDNPAAQVFFAAYAMRRRNFRETAAQEVFGLAQRADIGVSPADIVAFFRGLEDAQCGKMLGDADNARFEWLVKSIQASRLALATEVEAALDAPSTTIAHALRLRANWTLTLDLPPDFTAEEAERLCYFVRALPLTNAPKPVETDNLPEQT